MKTINEIFLSMFEKIESTEDLPTGINILIWDGCDFHLDYVDTDVDTGVNYMANNTEPLAYIALPYDAHAEAILGNGE